MLLAQANHKLHANKQRSSALQYKIRNMVWLNIKNLITKGPNRKLKNVNGGKYAVKKIISPHDIKLELPPSFQIYPVFYVNPLEPATTNSPHSGYVQSPGQPLIIDRNIE